MRMDVKVILIGFIFLITFIMTGCQKTIFIPIKPSCQFRINQQLATESFPAQFYVCGNDCYPCQLSTQTKNKKQQKSHLSIYKSLGAIKCKKCC